MPRVIIRASQKIRYKETHDISDKAWKLYQEMCEANAKDRDFTYHFEHLIDGDSPDSGEMTDLEIELVEEPASARS